MTWESDTWQYSTPHKSPCRVIETQTLWGQTACRIWLPNQNAVVLVAQSDLQPLSGSRHPAQEAHRVAYVAAAAKVAEILENSATASDDHVLLAPMESNVIPLPHQMHALSRAMSGDRVRYLLADEVGLGKTIEAGLIMRELKLRGMARRILVVAPKSLAMQWVAEMETHFNETFTLVNPSDLDALERLEQPYPRASVQEEYNPWLRFPQAIVTLDAVKPLIRRRGWSKERIQEYNHNRYEKLILGQWDLIVVDEAHRLGGSTDQVARYKLGRGLAEAAPYVLLLSATPHQGKSDAFHRLMSLLDPMTFPDMESMCRESIAHFVIRTEKRKAITADGKALFRPRTTQTLEVDLNRNPAQVALYNAVTEYVKKGYNQAMKNRKPHLGFLMVLLQRIVASSSHAIRCTLERRLEILQSFQGNVASFDEEDFDDFIDVDGQTQLDVLMELNEAGRAGEVIEVDTLLDLARAAEVGVCDVKAEVLLDTIFQLQGEENDAQLKILIFTEFVATQTMLQTFLTERGLTCAVLNGSMSMEERKAAQCHFREYARILIATDAGGEGLNLQFCHVVINYDLPWNPMRIEQRIGRVDRIGQSNIVRAINFVYKNSVESRVRTVLEKKLALILAEMGIDKVNDILDSTLSGEVLERMMITVIMDNADAYGEVDQAVQHIQSAFEHRQDHHAVYSLSETPDLASAEALRSHPLPHWVEQMTLHYLYTKECPVEKTEHGWNFTWPHGEVVQRAVFRRHEEKSQKTLLTLEHPQIRTLALNLPQVVAGQPLPSLTVNGLPESVAGFWGLFEIRLSMQQLIYSSMNIPYTRRAYLAVFTSNEGKLFVPTARHIWNQLLTNDFRINSIKDTKESLAAHEVLLSAVQRAGEELFSSMQEIHARVIQREAERGAITFASRRRAIEQLGLPEVRKFRLLRLQEEESQWHADLLIAQKTLPEIRPILTLYIENGIADG